MNEVYYNVEQIAQILNIHPKTVQRYIREGKLRAVKLGKSWRVTGHDLSMFVENADTGQVIIMPSLPQESARKPHRSLILWLAARMRL